MVKYQSDEITPSVLDNNVNVHDIIFQLYGLDLKE